MRRSFIGDRFHLAKFSAPIRSRRGDKRLRIGVFESGNNCRRAESGKKWQENSADLNNREHRDHDLWNHWHEHTDGIAFTQSQAAQGASHLVHFLAKFLISEYATRAVFGFRFDCDFVLRWRVGVLIEHVVDDIHFAIDAPNRPGLALAKIDNARVRFVKLDIEIAEHRVPEPSNVGRRSSHQFPIGTERMFLDEALQIGLCDELRRRMPDKFAAKLEFAHVQIVRVL